MSIIKPRNFVPTNKMIFVYHSEADIGDLLEESPPLGLVEEVINARLEGASCILLQHFPGNSMVFMEYMCIDK